MCEKMDLEQMSELNEKYFTEGFVIAKNIVSEKRRNALLENIFKLYCKYSNDIDEFSGLKEPWNDDLFHLKLIELRKKDPDSFGAIYDSLKTSLTLTQLITDDAIVQRVATFLKITPSDVSLSEPMTRMDVPMDVRNKLDWHQERSFFPQNRDGMKGLVCWVPLFDVTPELGQLSVCPHSHEGGLLDLKSEKKQDLTYTTQIPVPEEEVKKYEVIKAPMKAGDALFFNMLLFHKSGENTSNKIRFSVQGRFHTATADDFIPFDFVNYYNPIIKQRLIKKNYDCSDIPDNIRQPPVAI